MEKENRIHVDWRGVVVIGALSVALLLLASSFPSKAAIRCDEPYILVEREGYLTEYMTEAEFCLIASFMEAVAGDKSMDAKSDLADIIINRYFSSDYPDKWDELIWKKDDRGLWDMLPEDIELEDVVASKETLDALYIETVWGKVGETDIAVWEETYGDERIQGIICNERDGETYDGELSRVS